MDALTTLGPDRLPPLIWREFADQLPQLVWMADGDGRPCWFNRRCLEYSGLSLDELLGSGWYRVIDPEALPRVVATWEAALASGSSYECITPLRGRDGDCRQFLARAEPHRSADGKVIYWFGTNTDITSQVTAENHSRYLLELQEVLTGSRTADEAKKRVTELLGRALKASRVFYAEVDADRLEARIQDEYLGGEVPSIAGTHRIPKDVFDHYSRGEPLVSADFHSDPVLASARADEALASLPFRAVLDLPLLRDGHLVGLLAVHDVEPRTWSAEEIALARATAERSWDTVERGRAEEQLRRSEEQFRTTAEAVPGLLFVTDREGRNLYVNRFYKDYTGRHEDGVGDTWHGAIHPDDLPAVLEATERARASGVELQLDYRLRRHDGAFRWHSTKASPTRDQRNEIVSWVGVSLDVHDRREAEEQAQAAAEEIETIYASAPVGLAVLDREFRYVRINERLAEINGIAAEDHLGRTVRELLPLLADQIEPALAEVLEGKEAWGVEVIGETPAAPGVSRTWRENWLPVRGVDGEIIGVALSAEEITSEKLSDLALARSEAQFRTVAEALPGMLFITTLEGNTYVNETFATYAGLPKEELLGTGWLKTLHPDDADYGNERWTHAVRTGEPYEAEYRFLRHDGEYRWHTVRALRIDGEANDAEQKWVGTCIDIHDRKLVEEELRESEAFARRISDVAPAVLYIYDLAERRNVWGNREMVETLRYSYSDIEALGDNLMERLMHPDDLARFPDHVARLMKLPDGESAEFRYRFLKPDGGHVWLVSQDMIFRRDENGVPTQIVGAALDITEQEDALQALRQSEERYRALFESMEQGFCTIQVTFDDADRPIDYFFKELNPAFAQHTGLRLDVLNKSVREAVPGLEQAWFDRYGEVARTEQSQRFIDHAEALGRWFEVYAFPIGERSENMVALLFSDVTDRIEQEEALRRSEQELRERLNAIPQMVWSTLPDGHHDFYNDRWYEFTGTSIGSTDGEGWNIVFHPDDQPLAWERWSHSLATGEPYEIEYRLRHHSGEYRWVLGRALPIRNEDGEIVRWMGTCTDIDDRVAARRALQDSEARLRAVIDAMPVGLLFADPAGQITGGNARVEEIVGHRVLPSSDFDSYGEWVAFHSDGRQVQSREYPLAQVLTENCEQAELECKYQRGDGQRKWLRFNASAIRDTEGTLLGGVVASIDIDREKRLTEGLEREVGKVIAEREAAQEALRQSQKLEAMGQLTGGVAHDFNNLLTPIIGSLDLLQRKQILDDRTGRLVEGALASAEKARVLVQRLLAFARRQPLKPQPIDLKRVIGEMSELVNSTSGPRIRVLTDLPEELPAALADGNQLEMALLNLSVNARDAMPDGGTLTIAARSELEGAGGRLGLPRRPHVVLSVTDTGLGMDEETRRRAIEPFFSTKGFGKGTGLGLSMVHGLAAQLGGALDIRSAPGVGTTIELWLPLAGEAVANGQASAGEVEPHGAGTVLLVDDEDLVRASTAGMLTDLGYHVVEADCGEAAMSLVARGLKPDLLVTDQLMPGLSGTDLAVNLSERFADLPVLIVSGYADLESLSPAFPHLSKPFRQTELAAALDRVTT